MDEHLVLSHRLLTKDTDIHQFLEINGCGLAFGDAGVHRVGNPAVGLNEDQLHRFSGKNSGQPLVDCIDLSIIQRKAIEDLIALS
jgi:hypothetical protein